jgi:hypothetical protein
MPNAEDLMYEAISEGIRDDVFAEVTRLRKTIPKLEKKDFADVLDIALNNIRKKKNENL